MKVFVVTGMHRSATSLVAKGLHNSGVYMGDKLLGKHKSNPWGHFEDVPALKINQAILKAAGGSWSDPPSHDSISRVDPATAAAYVKYRADDEMWGFKDPRFSLTWPVWLPSLRDFDLHVIACRRSDEEVAQSLHRRDGLPVADALRLAEIYRRRLDMLMEAL